MKILGAVLELPAFYGYIISVLANVVTQDETRRRQTANIIVITSAVE